MGAGKLKLAPPIEALEGQTNFIRNNRLNIMDKRSGQSFLIDTGAEISVLPVSPKTM